MYLGILYRHVMNEFIISSACHLRKESISLFISGDHWYKRNETKSAQEQMISPLPDIQSTTLEDQDEFLIIACDGIW